MLFLSRQSQEQPYVALGLRYCPLPFVLASVLLPRDAMHKRGYSRHAVSVRPSITFVDHVKTNKVSSKFFHHRVATPSQFFHTKRGGDIPTGTPLTEVSTASGL